MVVKRVQRKYHITLELANDLFTALKKVNEVPKDYFFGMQLGSKGSEYKLTNNPAFEVVLDNLDLLKIKKAIDKAVLDRKVQSMRATFPVLLNKELEKKQREDANADRKKKVEEAFQKIEVGVSDIFTSANYADYLRFRSKLHRYSVNNQILIWLQNPDAGYVMSFKKWKEVGRYVKKGQKAIEILAPIQKKVTTVQHDDKGSVMLDENGEQLTKDSSYTYYKFVPVFADNQTEGEELPSLVTELEGESSQASNLIKRILEVSKTPIEFIHSDKDSTLSNSCNGYYVISDRRIVVKDNMSVNQKAKTLVHEYAHAILHCESNSLTRNRKELEAESLAFIVCDYFGLDTSDYTFGYLASWKGREDLKETLVGIDKKSKEVIALLEGK